MRILIVTEKPSIMSAIAASLRRTCPWPGATVYIVSTQYLGFYRYAWPAGVKAADMPFVGDVAMRPAERWETHNLDPWPFWGGYLEKPEADERTDRSKGFFVDRNVHGAALADPARATATLAHWLDWADLVIEMTDAGHRGAVEFWHVLTLGRTRQPDRPGQTLLSASLTSMHNEAFDDPFRRMVSGDWNERVCSWSADAPRLRYGMAKTFFDYNWSFNGSGLLAAPLRRVGVPPTVTVRGAFVPAAQLLSKYALVLLTHMVAEGVETSEGMLLSSMCRWKGSGKYARSELGSPASSSQIVENLCQLGLLERFGKRGIRVSRRGAELVASLPKSAYDPDLPARLERWCLEWPASRPKMEAYIRRFFGAVKRASGMDALLPGGPDGASAAARLLEAGSAEGAARASQVAEGAVLAAAAGEEVSVRQARAIALAARRLGAPGRPHP